MTAVARRRRRSGMVAVASCMVLGAVVWLGTPPLAAQESPSSNPTAEEIRQAADDVLARQEFQRPEPTLLERVRDWLGERLTGLIDGLTGGGAGSLVGWVVLIAAVGALVWSLTRLGRTVRTDPAPHAQVKIDQGRTPDAWRGEADRLEAEGEWKDALRCRYRALLGDLARAGVIEDVPGRTTGEYRREVEAALPDAAEPMGRLTELFEWAWYADRSTGPDETRRFREAAVVVSDAATGPRPALVGAGAG